VTDNHRTTYDNVTETAVWKSDPCDRDVQNMMM